MSLYYDLLYFNGEKTENVPREILRKNRSSVKLAVALLKTGEVSLYPDFTYITEILEPGDLLIFNDSLMLPSSLWAREVSSGRFCRIHVGQPVSKNKFLAEIRPKSEFGNIPGEAQFSILNSEVIASVAGRNKEFPRYVEMTFTNLNEDMQKFLLKMGEPIFYEGITRSFDYAYYKNVFQTKLGSSEYPSASRPFNDEILNRLTKKGIQLSTVTLHCNLASLERTEFQKSNVLLPEFYDVRDETVEKVENTVASGKRVIAVGTTVARAIVSACNGGSLKSVKGITTLKIGQDTDIYPLSGIITGVHDPDSSHNDLLSAFTGDQMTMPLNAMTSAFGLGGHEFGDSVAII